MVVQPRMTERKFRRMRSRSTRTLLAAAAALTLIAIPAAQASAHEFNASTAGTIEGKQLGSQKFKVNAGNFECTKATAKGTVVKGSQKNIRETVKYTGCTFFGASMTATPAEYEFNAEGTVSLLNTVTLEVPIAGCQLTVAPASAIKSVAYKNLAGGLLESKLTLTGVPYTTTGGICGTGGALEANGALQAGLASGTLEWK